MACQRPSRLDEESKFPREYYAIEEETVEERKWGER
jgi:hypothetical protein